MSFRIHNYDGHKRAPSGTLQTLSVGAQRHTESLTKALATRLRSWTQPQNVPVILAFNTPGTRNYLTSSTLSVSVFDLDGDGIDNVAYYANDVLIGQSTSSPDFQVTWPATPAGTYNLKAVATDVRGGVGESDVVVCPVTNQQPVVTFDMPTNLVEGETITLNCAVSDAENSIQIVRYYQDGNLIGSSSTGPHYYLLDVTLPAPGTYTFSAEATDTGGAQGSASVVRTTIPSGVVDHTGVRTGSFSVNDVIATWGFSAGTLTKLEVNAFADVGPTASGKIGILNSSGVVQSVHTVSLTRIPEINGGAFGIVDVAYEAVGSWSIPAGGGVAWQSASGATGRSVAATPGYQGNYRTVVLATGLDLDNGAYRINARYTFA
jgi:hypothetical protein